MHNIRILAVLYLSFPYDQKKYCGGGSNFYETAANAYTAIMKIYIDVEYPSILYVPELSDGFL